MVLQAQKAASHNRMLGQKIPHPASTKFFHQVEMPASKRLKRHESTDSSLARQTSDDESDVQAWPCRPLSRAGTGSEAEEDTYDEDLSAPAQKTNLESALPPIKTDKEAIAEYEATRLAETNISDLHSRLGQRKWVQGKSSIYVDAFNLALETVLEDESHLFDAAEMSVFEHWRKLSYEAQYLYVLWNIEQYSN